MKYLTIIVVFFLAISIQAQTEKGFEIARLKYDGGGDWYNGPSRRS